MWNLEKYFGNVFNTALTRPSGYLVSLGVWRIVTLVLHSDYLATLLRSLQRNQLENTQYKAPPPPSILHLPLCLFYVSFWNASKWRRSRSNMKKKEIKYANVQRKDIISAIMGSFVFTTVPLHKSPSDSTFFWNKQCLSRFPLPVLPRLPP